RCTSGNAGASDWPRCTRGSAWWVESETSSASHSPDRGRLEHGVENDLGVVQVTSKGEPVVQYQGRCRRHERGLLVELVDTGDHQGITQCCGVGIAQAELFGHCRASLEALVSILLIKACPHQQISRAIALARVPCHQIEAQVFIEGVLGQGYVVPANDQPITIALLQDGFIGIERLAVWALEGNVDVERRDLEAPDGGDRWR